MKSITRRRFIGKVSWSAGGALAVSSPGLLRATKAMAKPNIVYIFADQMRFSAMGCMAGVAGAADEPSCVKTPNLDRLAADGILFENAFSTTPVCSPHRTGLQTGKYSHVTGFKLSPRELTLPQILGRAGYRTGYVGKWHMTPHEHLTESGYVLPEFRQGWDYFAGLEVSHKYFDTSIFIGDDRTPIRVPGYEPAFQTDLAIEFLRQNKGRPNFLMLSWGPPHNPYTPPDEHDLYSPELLPLRPNIPKEYEGQARRSIAGYYGLVSSLDHEIGRITVALDELGLADNTLLCFSSDHGDMLYSLGQRLKRRPWDEAARIPLIMRWPDRLDGGQRRDFVLGSVDFMPTLLGLVGLEAPKTVQGQDRSGPVRLGRGGEPTEIFLEQIAPGNTAHNAQWRAIRTKDWLFAVSGHLDQGDWLLYDMQKDPFQMKNLVADAETQQIRKKLKFQLQQWRTLTGDGEDIRKDFLRRTA